MQPNQNEDSVVEEQVVPPTVLPHPTDPFLNPRRSTGAATTQHQSNQSVMTKSAEETTSRADPSRRSANSSSSPGLPAPSTTNVSADAAQPSLTPVQRCVPKRRRPETPSTTTANRKRERLDCVGFRDQLAAQKTQLPASARRVGNATSSPTTESDASSSSEEYEGSGVGQPGADIVAENVLLGGAGSDDDGEGDAEEKALIAAATGAVSDTHGASNVGAPHPWLVTDAFHASLWYVLRYAGSALSAADLWACRAVLLLTAALPPPSAPVLPPPATEASPENDQDSYLNTGTCLLSSAWTWTGTEESELLLRLVLRKPHGFTGRHLEARYGDWLHVQPTLTALTQRRFWWWASRPHSDRHQAERKNHAGTAGNPQSTLYADTDSPAGFSPFHDGGAQRDIDMFSPFMLEQYDGERVARMVLQGTEGAPQRIAESAALSSTTEELIRVLQAVRGTEMRLFLTSLRHGSKSHASRAASTQAESLAATPQKLEGNRGGIVQEDAASRAPHSGQMSPAVESSKDRQNNSTSPFYKNTALGDNSLYDAIPGRKQDMIRYFVERRYSLWAPTVQPAAADDSPNHSGATSAAAALKPRLSDSNADTRLVRNTTGGEAQQRQQRRARRSDCTAAAPVAKQGTIPWGTASLPVKTCFRDAEEEALLVARCWDTHVGAVYAPHAGLKAHMVWITELFHVLTSNGGAGVIGQQEVKPLAATMAVAAPPTLLMLRPQLLLLLQSLRSARQLHRQVVSSSATGEMCKNPLAVSTNSGVAATDIRHTIPQETANAAFPSIVPHALLPRWFEAPTTVSVGPSPPPAPSNPALPASDGDSGGGFVDVQRGNSSVRGVESDLGDEALICSARSFHAPNVGDDGTLGSGAASGIPPPVQLFGTPAMLQEYRVALYTQRTLYEATEGAVTAAQRFRARSEVFVAHMYDTVLSAVRTGVAAVRRHPLKYVTAPALAADAARFVPCPPHRCASPQQPPFSLDAVLSRRGNFAEHLLLFTPLFRWFACLELLYPILQSARRYAEANECLHFLLDEPVYVLHHIPQPGEDGVPSSSWTVKEAAQVARRLSPVTYAFRYKTHKRGEWLSRLAQNLTHLKRYPEALALLEEAQAGYHELAEQLTSSTIATMPSADTTNAAAATLCSVLTGTTFDESKLPVEVKRRGRMLRVLWPLSGTAAAAAAVSTGIEGQRSHNAPATPCLPLYHAVWEYVRDRYCRRHDRLALEKSLAMLHRRVRQWTPLAAHRQLATRQLADVAVRRVAGVRDAMDYMLWREPNGSSSRDSYSEVRTAKAAPSSNSNNVSSGGNERRPALPVELFVLEHFVRKWNAQGSSQDHTTTLQASTRKQQREGSDAASVLATSVAAEVEANLADLRRGGGGRWCGAHCEGQWIRCLAHALLWDCYWAYPAPSHSAKESGDSQPADHELLWLSAFQDGPLDVTTPLNFLLRRRAFIEERLSQLERYSRDELLALVASRIKADSPDAQGAQQRTSAVQATTINKHTSTPLGAVEDSLRSAGARDVGGNGEAETGVPQGGTRHTITNSRHGTRPAGFAASPSAAASNTVKLTINASVVSDTFDGAEEEEGEEDMMLLACTLPSPPLSASTATVPCGQADNDSLQRQSQSELVDMLDGTQPATNIQYALPTCSTIPEAWKVPVGSLPLLDILRVLPLPPLWRLLRCLYLSPVTEGVPLRFSGFPDLVFWRSDGGLRKSEDDRKGVNVASRDGDGDDAPLFRLMEVKSPSDTLSTKQISVNDILHRCGFDVCVLRVDAVHDNGVPVSTKKLR
jgi:hypothetical protein